MAVPDTTTFSLQDVITELGLSNTSSLRDCFNNAVSGYFDTTYEGLKDRLSNFRNYGGGDGVPVYLGYSDISGENACAASQAMYFLPPGESFNTATALYGDMHLKNEAIFGYYSDGTVYREWDTFGFGSSAACGL